MRHGNFSDAPDRPINWRIASELLPYLLRYKGRLLLAFACLVLSKAAVLTIPFFMKAVVDTLDTKTDAGIATGLLLGIILAYGAARFSNVLFGELRDTVFGRVT